MLDNGKGKNRFALFTWASEKIQEGKPDAKWRRRGKRRSNKTKDEAQKKKKKK